MCMTFVRQSQIQSLQKQTPEYKRRLKYFSWLEKCNLLLLVVGGGRGGGGVEIFVNGQARAELLARLPACRMLGSEFESLRDSLLKKSEKEFLCISV